MKKALLILFLGYSTVTQPTPAAGSEKKSKEVVVGLFMSACFVNYLYAYYNGYQDFKNWRNEQDELMDRVQYMNENGTELLEIYPTRHGATLVDPVKNPYYLQGWCEGDTAEKWKKVHKAYLSGQCPKGYKFKNHPMPYTKFKKKKR